MSIPALGHFALFLALAAAVYAAAAGGWAYRSGNLVLGESARGATVGAALSLTTAVLILEDLLVTGDFSVQAVYNHVDRALPLIYRIGALWGGDSGSVLFWGWLLSLYTAYLAVRHWPREVRLTPAAVPALAAILVFFAGLSALVVNPFAPVPGHPVDGAGLDPLLQNLVMTLHPPTMYIGLIGMAVPAAYILAAVWTRAPAGVWLPVARRWMLFAWLFLSAAIVLGGMWAYMVLGWGGYWDWDPVENASLMPWLLATAFLHSAQVEERRGLFRWWTALLGVSAFLLTLVGTYITRSGVLKDSVHSFTGTGVGPYFTVLFWALVAVAGWIFYFRRRSLRDPEPVEEGLSREAVYLLVNVVLTAVTAVVLTGTFYPILSKALGGTSVVLTARFFNAMTAPFFILLLLLMGAAPAFSWRRSGGAAVARNLALPAAAGALGAAALWPLGFNTGLDALGVAAALFAFTSMVRELGRAAAARRRQRREPWTMALSEAIWRDRRRYGGYLAHMAFVVLALGVIGSHTGPAPAKVTLRPGQAAVVDGYRIRYARLTTASGAGHVTTLAHLDIVSGGTAFAAEPGDAFYPGTGEPVARVFIRGGWLRDLYVVLAGWVPSSQQVTLEVIINPMVSWIWMGMYGMAAATLLALSAPDRRRRVLETARPVERAAGGGLAVPKEVSPR